MWGRDRVTLCVLVKTQRGSLEGQCLFSVMVSLGAPSFVMVVGVRPDDGGCPGMDFPHLSHFHITLNYGSRVTFLSGNALGFSLKGPPGELIELFWLELHFD